MPDFVLDKEHPDYQEHYRQLLFALERDGPLIVHVKKKTKKRSIKQGRYYFGVVLKYIFEETGIHPILLHLFFKQEFIPWVVFEDAFELSTKNLTTEEMWDYIELIRTFSATFLHCPIPDAYSVHR